MGLLKFARLPPGLSRSHSQQNQNNNSNIHESNGNDTSAAKIPSNIGDHSIEISKNHNGNKCQISATNLLINDNDNLGLNIQTLTLNKQHKQQDCDDVSRQNHCNSQISTSSRRQNFDEEEGDNDLKSSQVNELESNIQSGEKEEAAATGNTKMDSFKVEYDKFVVEFDKLIGQDQFNAEPIYKLAREFVDKHKQFMQSIPFGSLTNSSYPNCSAAISLEEDNKLVSSPEGGSLAGPESKICSDVYRRLARATYLYQTLQFLHDRKSTIDRHEGIDYARYAIRYDSHNVLAVIAHAVALGWYLDNIGSGLDRVRLGRLFYFSVEYAIKLDSKQALPHHMRGRYYFSVSQLSWIERKLALTLFTAKEMSFTINDCEKSLRLAQSLDGELPPTGLWMAKCFAAQKKPKEQIVEWVEFGMKAKSFEPINDIEREELEEFKRKGKY